MHGEGSRYHQVPAILRSGQSALPQNPQQKSDSHVDVVPEVTNEVAASDVVDDVQLAFTHDELITQRTGNPLVLGDGLQILGEP